MHISLTTAYLGVQLSSSYYGKTYPKIPQLMKFMKRISPVMPIFWKNPIAPSQLGETYPIIYSSTI